MNKMTRLIALLLVLVMSAVFVMTSCQFFPGGDNPGGGGTGDGPGDTGEGGSGTPGDETLAEADYTVSVKTAGGMAMENITVYIFGYADGAVNDSDFVDALSTDADGNVKIKLSTSKSYAAVLEGVPEGYNTSTHYPITSVKTNVVLSSSVITGEDVAGKKLTAGDIMYDFEVTKDNGKKFKLSETLKTYDAVLINFWYDGCSWCETEFPIMDEVYNNEDYGYKDKIAIIALSPQDTIEQIKLYKRNMGLNIDMGEDKGGVLSTAFNVTGYPTSVVIDKYGMISLIEPGALTTERPWKIVFDHFTAENYKQQIIPNVAAITPIEKPGDYGITTPSAEEIAAAFEKTPILDASGNVLGYRNDPDDDRSWPFIVDTFEGKSVIRPSNDERVSSYAQMFVTVNLKAGEALAFDYYSSTERYMDIMYVLVDKKDIFSISGDSTGEGWKTCYAYVAEEAGEYELALCYIKDESDDYGDDTVYLNDFRIVNESDIDEETYIYRYASTAPNDFGEYTDHVDVVLNQNDGYYHVGTADGPILLADLMGFTHYSSTEYFYQMIIGTVDEAIGTKYCSYASNSQISGLCSVTEELAQLLKKYSGNEGNRWLEFCCYYSAYGTENGKQLEDPIKGLSTFSAYDIILSESGTTDFPNSVTYDRVIMPRGKFFKFTPDASGVYLVVSNSWDESKTVPLEVDAWIFKEEDIETKLAWLSYENVDRMNTDSYNCYMVAYLEAGVDYYIDVAYYDLYQNGTIDFRLERLPDDYLRFSSASAGFFTYIENSDASINKIIAGGIDVIFSNGYWFNDLNGELGSYLYADFTKPTNIFTTRPIYDPNAYDMFDAGAFDFRFNDTDQDVINYMKRSNALSVAFKAIFGDDYDNYVTILELKNVYKDDYAYKNGATINEKDAQALNELAKAKDDVSAAKTALISLWGDSYSESYVDEVFAGTYHGENDSYIKDLVENGVLRALWGEDYEIYKSIYALTDAEGNGPDAKDAYVLYVYEKNGKNKDETIADLRAEWEDSFDANKIAYKVDEVLSGIYHSENAKYAEDLDDRAIFMLIWGEDYEENAENHRLDDVLAGIYHGVSPDDKDMEIIGYLISNNWDTNATERYLKNLWGDDFDEKADEYKLYDVFKGKYHGEGKDYTAEVLAYVEANIIKEGTVIDGYTITADDSRIGTVRVNEELSIWLQLLMDKYTFAGVDHSWTKLCYYVQSFTAANPT